MSLENLLVVGADALLRVALVGRVLDAEALLARNLQPLDPSQQLGALARKHRSHNQLNAASLTRVLHVLDVLGVFVNDRQSIALVLGCLAKLLVNN